MALPFDTYGAIITAIDKIGQGMTVSRACDEAGVSVAVFERTTSADPMLADLRTEAEVRGADAMADALVDIDNHKVYGQTNPSMARIISDNIKWLLEKRHAKKFGAKVEVQHTITADRAIIDALNAAKQRVAPVVIDAAVEAAEVVDEDDDALLRHLLS